MSRKFLIRVNPNTDNSGPFWEAVAETPALQWLLYDVEDSWIVDDIAEVERELAKLPEWFVDPRPLLIHETD